MTGPTTPPATPTPPAARRPRVPRVAEVVRTSYVTPHMIRVVLGGAGLAGFTAGEFTDHYVKLLFPPAGAAYAAPYDVEQIRAELPREQWPVTRTYTVRSWDAATGELAIDFVYHGDEGLAGPWAAAARPGDVIQFMGPGGGYSPSPDADWHLLAGDEAALPAIAVALERLPAGVPTFAFVEVAGAEEEQADVVAREGVQLVWVHRGAAAPGEALVEAVRELRRHFRTQRGLDPRFTSISGYWRRGDTEDRWQATKREWNAAIEAEEAAAAG